MVRPRNNIISRKAGIISTPALWIGIRQKHGRLTGANAMMIYSGSQGGQIPPEKL
jgi:hypothetical protein